MSESNSVVPDPGGPDYATVEITSDEPQEYDFRERRAELLQLSRRKGSVDALPPQSELAERYGVTQQQVSKDFDRLAEYGAARLFDRDRELWETDLVVRRCVEGLLEDEEWRAAAKTALEREEWRAGAVDLTELYERVERLEGVDSEEVV